MAATLASLWEKKKKVQPNPAINQVDHSLTEGPGGDSQANAKAFQAGESGNSCSRQCDKAADPVGSDRQTFRPEKKRKRAQLSGEQDANFDILQGSNGQLSAEDTIDAGRKVEQLKKILSDQQHNADNKSPMACAESSQVLGPDKTDTTSTKQGQADAECADAATSQQVVSGQTTAAPAAAAILAHNGSLSEVSEQAQASNKEHVLKQHQSQLTQCIQQAQAIKPMADLPCLIDGQLDRAQVSAFPCQKLTTCKSSNVPCSNESMHAAGTHSLSQYRSVLQLATVSNKVPECHATCLQYNGVYAQPN